MEVEANGKVRWIANWCPRMELLPRPRVRIPTTGKNPCWRDVDLVATKIQRVARATAIQGRQGTKGTYLAAEDRTPATWGALASQNDRKTPPLPAVRDVTSGILVQCQCNCSELLPKNEASSLLTFSSVSLQQHLTWTAAAIRLNPTRASTATLFQSKTTRHFRIAAMHRTALPQRLGRNAHAALLRRQVPSTVLRASFSTSIRAASGAPDVIVPRVAKVSFWKSLVPKFLRFGDDSIHHTKMPKSNEWNPATFFIIIFLMIGSMAIQMISLKKDFAAFSRQADVRINTLREVVERIQKGEEVDVEKVLGTGDPEKEAAWDEGTSKSDETAIRRRPADIMIP